MTEHEADREFDAWLAAVNGDINTALEEHLAGAPAAATSQPTTDRGPSRKRAEAARESMWPGPASPREIRVRTSLTSPSADRPPIRDASSPPRSFDDITALEDASFLTVAEVAAVMRVSKMTVYRMIHAGELPAVRTGRTFRVPAKSVREYLSNNTESSRPNHNLR